MKKLLPQHVFTFFLFLCLLPFSDYAQSVAIRGVVRDAQTREKLSFVTVVLRDQKGIAVASSRTDFNFGEYELDSIANGTYRLEYQLKGYKNKTIEEVVVYSNHILVKNVKIYREFSRFVNKDELASTEPLFYQDKNVDKYLIYSGLTMMVIAAIALR